MSNFAAAMPTARFRTIGDKVSGTVVETRMVPVPDFDDAGKPSGLQFDEAGAVIMRPDVIVETDKGIFIIHTGGGLFFALGAALAEIGATDLVKGDTLSVEYIGDGEPQPGLNPPKLYDVTITKA